MATKILVRRDSYGNFEQEGTVLELGEIAVVIDTNVNNQTIIDQLFFGDGINPISFLRPFASELKLDLKYATKAQLAALDAGLTQADLDLLEQNLQAFSNDRYNLVDQRIDDVAASFTATTDDLLARVTALETAIDGGGA